LHGILELEKQQIPEAAEENFQGRRRVLTSQSVNKLVISKAPW